MAEHSQFRLLRERRFAPYFATQFLGAFNDNVFKNALIILIAFQGVNTEINSHTLINLSAGLFILPFFLFSATSGQIADKFEKSSLIRIIKGLEVIIMMLASLGFYLGSLPLLLLVLFLMGTQSSLFGPLKYGILPQQLHPDELIGGNGLVGMGTFLAILLGTITGGILIGLEQGALLISGTVLLIAILGFLSSQAIPTAKAVDPTLQIRWNPLLQTWRILKFTAERHTVFLSVLAISWFWFLGATYLAQIPNYARLHLGGNEQVVTLLLTLFSLGVGLGSIFCERLSGHKVELGLVPFGSIGLSLFGIDLSFAEVSLANPENLMNASAFLAASGSFRVLFDVGMIGLFGGFFIVPLYALVQQRSNPAHLSRIIAGNNIINALLMVFSAGLAIFLLNAGLDIPQLFLTIALMNIVVAIYIYTLVPEFFMRFLVWIFIHLVYRVQKENLDKIPDKGAMVLVCNHVSFFDPLLIAGSIRRPVRFVMYYKIYQIPGLNFIFRTAGAIPIASNKENPEIFKQAWERIEQTLKAGEVLCIFPEGKITRNGNIGKFRPGIERIIAENPIPVLPMALCGLWGTFFSREGGSAMSHLPRHWMTKITLKAGEVVAPEQASAAFLQTQVENLRADKK
ncbi:MFS transporter [Candidatus Venteria ishoeyi]|uniref:Lysophospholipid transporter LplT n=1 Tax=Candidatus Venteria ishoeyi TaxID=1899563 RepID=A0A1H6F4K5_9GAMM|nr:MFS transporter [Candidatus Venteria ishoeyi]SEH05060.1 Lysophospholipid transporter LplT [Candidatus Venteria ishoeyi]